MNDISNRKALEPLEALLADDAVTEIMVDAPDRVIVERKGKLEDAGVKFESPEALRAAIDATLALGGATLQPGQTVAHTRLSDGSRILAVLPPTAVNAGPYLVIRKVWKTTLTMNQLLEWGVITPEARALLQSAILAPRNFLVTGGTGSGKTTLLNLLVDEIPADQRVVAVEPVFELHLRHPRAINLSADRAPDISFSDLVVTGSWMRPDWLIVGELLGSEALQVLQIMSRGHSGMTTMHATSVEDALSRLEAMCLMANMGLGLGDIRTLIASAIHVITHQEKMRDGSRRVMQIAELRGVENDRYVLQPLMRYNPDTGKLEATGSLPGWES
ncbi:MAG TPA: ATPase, T2SS/T4P/T4SS family [Anaerolineae bacterium]|nr:ATPase, T2SS/T4P/T4SS family [Anaerolineae bacterium]